jgi:RHS repeat-associated protein
VDILDSGSLKIQYNRNRYYDYYTGRWLTHDPLGYVDGMNLYEYVKSNPATGIDPWGLDKADCKWDHSADHPHDYKIDTEGGKGPALMPWEHGRWNRASVPWHQWPKVLNIVSRARSMIAGGTVGEIVGLGRDLPDAKLHFIRYMSNTGLQIDTDLTRMIRDSIQVQMYFVSDVGIAMKEAERILDGLSGSESSVDIVQQGYTHHDLNKKWSKNWYYALGTYHTWGKGSVRKGKGRKNCCYYMNWSYNLRDNYEFQNLPLRAYLVRDDEMWLLNKYGLARHFRIRAVKGLKLTWIRGFRFVNFYGDFDAAKMLNEGAQHPFPQCQ